MPDREKILKALEHHKETAVCNGCPYCPIYDDVIALLREQENVCSAYRVEYGKSVCWGTKEREACSCGGNRAKCDFYSLSN